MSELILSSPSLALLLGLLASMTGCHPARRPVDDKLDDEPRPRSTSVVTIAPGSVSGSASSTPTPTLPVGSDSASPANADQEQCTPEKARHAARLLLRAAPKATRPAIPDVVLKGAIAQCDAAQAQCSNKPAAYFPPPTKCRLTLHDTIVRADLPPGNAQQLQGIWAHVGKGATESGRVVVEVSTASAVMVGGHRVTVAGVTSRHRHQHGGKSATITSVHLMVDNPTGQELSFRVRQLEFLRDYSCASPTEVKAQFPAGPNAPVSIKPGRSEIFLSIAPQPAYQSHCDMFATRAKLQVAGKEMTVTGAHNVMRFEPMRPQ